MLLLPQDTEAGDLFAQKSAWAEIKRGFWAAQVQLGQVISLWRTAIQTVECKHGCVRCSPPGLCMQCCMGASA